MPTIRPATLSESLRILLAIHKDAFSNAEQRDITRSAERLDFRWLAFDIGCIECGEESAVIGVFNTKKEAEDACNNAADIQAKDWHGEHYFEVFDLSEWIPCA